MDMQVSCKASFDKDGHASAIAGDSDSANKIHSLGRLRRGCIHLVCNMVDKYHSARKKHKHLEDGKMCDALDCSDACCLQEDLFIPKENNFTISGSSSIDDSDSVSILLTFLSG